MIKWIKKLMQIVGRYDADKSALLARIHELEETLRDRTEVATDVHFKGSSYVIVVGRYRNVDYVQTFTVMPDDFPHLVERLREMERFGAVRRIDAPPMMKAVFERDIRL